MRGYRLPTRLLVALKPTLKAAAWLNWKNILTLIKAMVTHFTNNHVLLSKQLTDLKLLISIILTCYQSMDNLNFIISCAIYLKQLLFITFNYKVFWYFSLFRHQMFHMSRSIYRVVLPKTMLDLLVLFKKWN